MNSKTVLSKILGLLSMDKEVELTYAKLKDGTIVESATFDVGEDLFVVSEDGTKTPAPDGEHELSLKDESGNENLIKVITKDGKIEEIRNYCEQDALCTFVLYLFYALHQSRISLITFDKIDR